MGGEFVDTNVLLYAHDLSAGARRDIALALIVRLIDEQIGLLSTQVLMEFFVSATRKLPHRLDEGTATEIVEDFGTWPVFTPGVSDILAAAKLSRRYAIHFWDALIVQGAVSLGADLIWSEDLNAGQKYAGVPVRNPFA
jgi:predicted nucleic acid-binding protein